MSELFGNLSRQILSMLLSPFWRQRPTCAHLINTCNNWFIDKNIVKVYNEFDVKLSKMRENENQFFYYYFCGKYNLEQFTK